MSLRGSPGGEHLKNSRLYTLATTSLLLLAFFVFIITANFGASLMSRTKLLVCDLDNTLYDSVGYFVPSFYAMFDSVVSITSCDREQLLNDFRFVHQRYSDSEQPFALLETATIRSIFDGFPTKDILQKLDPAFHVSIRQEKDF
jgi:hypothetical protein